MIVFLHTRWPGILAGLAVAMTVVVFAVYAI